MLQLDKTNERDDIMIEDTILRNQSLDIKISDIAFEITHKLLLDPKYENPPTYFNLKIQKTIMQWGKYLYLKDKIRKHLFL